MTVVLTETVSGETDRILPFAQDRTRTAAAEPDDLELLAVIGSQPHGSAQRDAACAVLVARYRGLVRSCARRYGRSAEPIEDLMQVGYVGLLKAINKFDPAYGRGLAAFAKPCVAGEIKRHFRDTRWPIYVKRPAKELAAELRVVTEQLTHELGRTPSEPDLARQLGVSAAGLRDAQLAELAFRPSSLDAPLSGWPDVFSLADFLGEEDPRIEHVLGMHALATHWGELPLREQQILVLRFRGGLTQTQIGQQLSLSQMHVSRLLAHALGHLRVRLLGLNDAQAEG